MKLIYKIEDFFFHLFISNIDTVNYIKIFSCDQKKRKKTKKEDSVNQY